MEPLHWNLSVLARAVHYKNLSGASAHIGISQPQLSRIVSRLEDELKVVLLDRTVRRKSGWTPVAHKIAETYARSSRKLSQSLSQLVSDQHISQLSVGTLEGLGELASRFCHQVFEQTRVQLIELDVFDLSELEERFERDQLDLIFTAREPGRQKFKNLRLLGYQSFDKLGGNSELKTLSPFEHTSSASKQRSLKRTRALVSNSLAIRRFWSDRFSAQGLFPSPIRERKLGVDGEVPVIMIGSDLLNPSMWQKLEAIDPLRK